MKQESLLNIEEVVASQNTKERDYWVKKMSGNPVKSIFPYDYKRNEKEHSMEVLDFDITGDVYSKLMKIINDSDPRLHMFLAAVSIVLLAGYSGNKDIIIGTPIYTPDVEGKFINTLLALRNRVAADMSFKELLLQVRQTLVEAVENQNYPIKALPYQLDMVFPENDFPLFDVVLLLENIQDRKYIQPIMPNIVFAFRRTNQGIQAGCEYNSRLYRKETIERMGTHFMNLLHQAVFNVNLAVSHIEILSEEEKKQVLYDFNDTKADYPAEKTLHQLFEEQVEKTPGNIAVGYNIDLSDIYENLDRKFAEIDNPILTKYEKCCFKRNPYLFTFEPGSFLELLDIVKPGEIGESLLIRTHKKNYVVVNHSLFLLLEYLDGEANLKSVFMGMPKAASKFVVYCLEKENGTGVFSAERKEFIINGHFEYFVLLINELWRASLVELVDYHMEEKHINLRLDKERSEPLKKNADDFAPSPQPPQYIENSKSPVLLLGDTPGTGSTGLLYLASFLRRNGIEAYCQWNESHRENASLKEHIVRLLTGIQPKLVGISMKWFTHIARVLEICRIIKDYNSSIEVVLGGNTAAYYSDNFISYDYIDYVVSGDGEVPLLKICTGEDDIPNCLYKREGKIVRRPISYVQDENNNSDVSLSHLEEIFVSKVDPYLAESFYISIGKGCAMPCFYCAGCRDTQKQIFNRPKPFFRDVEDVRKDIQAAKKYTSTLMFDFDFPASGYYKKVWQGIDLSNHFCEFYPWELPTAEFIDTIAKTFKYVTLGVDLCSLSQEHRKKLQALGLVKPQPTDEELFQFLDKCEEYDNIDVIISKVVGLPFFTGEDIEKSNDILGKILKEYSCFSGNTVWLRLHAQPGAPLTYSSEKYNMHSYAATFEDFLHYSQLNLKKEVYPDLDGMHYPYILPKDEELNSKISEFNVKAIGKIAQKREEKHKKINIPINTTYRELNEKANQLAHLLREKGLTVDKIAGLMVGRSIEMITGVLGVLKAGGAYLPLDPEYPRNRLAYMLNESDASILVTTEAESSLDFRGETIRFNSQEVVCQSTENPRAINTSRDLAYAIYTSGSTGSPKGVLIEHRNAVAYTCSSRELIRLTPEDTRLQQSSFSFDQFVEEVYPILSAGGKLIILQKSEVQNPLKLIEAVEENHVTIFSTTPAVLREVNKFPMTGRLRRILVGGDTLKEEDVSNIVKKIPVDNFYGPTETTAAAAHYHYSGKMETGSIPIGKPKSNYQVYILNSESKPVPVGVPGEIYISGDGVGRGYLNQPELTHEVFIPNTFISSTGKDMYKMYRTGDCGRWLPGGNIEFVGRIDRQVKIRGFRIELGEIEYQLERHQAVKEAVVIETNNNQLCAYIVQDTIHAPKDFGAAELVKYLGGQLPDYMIPLYFMPLEKIPLTPNGKVDRRALPGPEIKLGEDRPYIPPQNEVEEKLVEIWSEVLGIETNMISIEANFFELGGHSLTATIVLSRMHKEFDVRVSMGEIFKTPTIKEIASLINVIEWAENKKVVNQPRKEEIVI